jgi:hypothetical protein
VPFYCNPLICLAHCGQYSPLCRIPWYGQTPQSKPRVKSPPKMIWQHMYPFSLISTISMAILTTRLTWKSKFLRDLVVISDLKISDSKVELQLRVMDIGACTCSVSQNNNRHIQNLNSCVWLSGSHHSWLAIYPVLPPMTKHAMQSHVLKQATIPHVEKIIFFNRSHQPHI